MTDHGKTLASWARKGAALAPAESSRKMCTDCAFKHGSVPNTDPDCILDIHGCFMRERDFHCAHVDAPEGEEPVCAGFEYAQRFLLSAAGATIKKQYDNSGEKGNH